MRGWRSRSRRWRRCVGALVFGWFCVRLSGVYLAMLTLAFAQIVWSIAFQWDSRHRRLEWPRRRLAAGVARRAGTRTTASRWRRRDASRCSRIAWIAHAPFGYALRGARDSPLRAAALGIDVAARRNGTAFAIAGAFAGLAGGLFAFSKGSISPETLAIPRSVDALVMVLLGGLNALFGPLLGAAAFTWLRTRSRAPPNTGARCSASAILVHRARVSDGHRRRAARVLRATRGAANDARPCSRSTDLAKAFGGVDAVRDVSFTVAAGELVALIGPNGAGKTTCFNLVNGQLAPDARRRAARRRSASTACRRARSRARASAARSRSPRHSRR